eukprot:1160276-Pelagomonas_calceolata.AAC.11
MSTYRHGDVVASQVGRVLGFQVLLGHFQQVLKLGPACRKLLLIERAAGRATTSPMSAHRAVLSKWDACALKKQRICIKDTSFSHPATQPPPSSVEQQRPTRAEGLRAGFQSRDQKVPLIGPPYTQPCQA